MGDSAVPEDANDRDVDRYQLGPGRTELCRHLVSVPRPDSAWGTRVSWSGY